MAETATQDRAAEVAAKVWDGRDVGANYGHIVDRIERALRAYAVEVVEAEAVRIRELETSYVREGRYMRAEDASYAATAFEQFAERLKKGEGA